jgi:hypothetical protein
MFVGLNPSTADEVHHNPIIRRCVALAKAWGVWRTLYDEPVRVEIDGS